MTKFVIIPKEHWGLIDFNDCNESYIVDCKLCNDRSQLIVSYENEQPAFCYDISNDDIGLPEYNEVEILEIVSTPVWNRQS